MFSLQFTQLRTADASTLLSAAHTSCIQPYKQHSTAATVQQSITFLNILCRFPRLVFPLTLDWQPVGQVKVKMPLCTPRRRMGE